MILLRQPNRWSCLPTALAMTIGVSLSQVLGIIGHDGSEEWSATLDEPTCKVGFQFSEIIDAAYRLKHAAILVQAIPQAAREGEFIPLYNPIHAMERLTTYLENSKGILLGKGNNHGHAVANDHGMIYDPNGKTYEIQDAVDNNFNEIELYLLIAPII